MLKEKIRINEDGITEKWCPHCEVWKNREKDFSPKRGSNEKVHSWCKACCVNDVSERRKIKGRYESPLVGRIQILLGNIVCMNGEVRSKELHMLYKQQNGKCYYTGVEMKLMTDRKNDPLVMSVDRKDSSKGYTLDNIVLCCYGINALKGRHEEEYMYNILEQFYLGAKKLNKF